MHIFALSDIPCLTYLTSLIKIESREPHKFIASTFSGDDPEPSTRLPQALEATDLNYPPPPSLTYIEARGTCKTLQR